MRSKEEKIQRIMELSYPMSDIIARDWIEQAEEMGDRFLDHYSQFSVSSKDYYRYALNAWDIHTGLAFTKLYKALK